MKLNKFLEAADGQITGGTEYQWKCYGPDARYMDISNIDNDEIGSCVFDSKTKKVYEVTADVYDDNVAYRWIDPKYEDAYLTECAERNIIPESAYDYTNYTKITSSSEILELVHKIVHKTYVHSHCPPEERIDEVIKENIEESAVEDEYTVKVHVVQIFDVRANSMEEAAQKARTFASGMKPSLHIDGISWMDSYFSKEEVSRELVVKQYKE